MERTPSLRASTVTRSTIAVASRSRRADAPGGGSDPTRWLDSCLAVFPRDAWAELAEKLRSLPLASTQAREFGRFMSSGAVDVELDAGGACSSRLPADLRRAAAGEVIVVGVLNRLEIWAPGAWEPYRSRIEDAPEALAEQLQDLGI